MALGEAIVDEQFFFSGMGYFGAVWRQAIVDGTIKTHYPSSLCPVTDILHSNTFIAQCNLVFRTKSNDYLY